MNSFEKAYILNSPSKLTISYTDRENHSNNILSAFQKHKQDFAMQMQYRKLDMLISELEKELSAVKSLRYDMERYKIDFGLSVENEAEAKIKEVIDSIDKMFSK